MAGLPQLDWVSVKVSTGAAAYPDLSSESATDFLAVPWTAAGGVLVLAGAGTAVLVLRRRRRSDPPRPEPARDLAGAR